MIKIRKKNYIKEKEIAKIEANIDNHIFASNALNTERFENKWRGKNKHKIISLTEDNYQIKEIIKQYKSNKNQINGLSSKYLLQLSDLLGQKDKYFSKKRLELYDKRINKIKLNTNENEEKTSIPVYNSLSNVNSKLKRMFNSKKAESVTMYCTERYRNKKIFKKNNNLTEKSKTFKYLLTKPINKKKNFINKNKIVESMLLTQYNSKNEDENYDDSLKGKEEYLLNRDKEKYHEYLKNEYNFFNNNNMNEILFLNEKNKRNKLFKSISNYKYIENKKNDPFKNTLFNKINRKKDNDFNLSKYQNTKKLKLYEITKRNTNHFFKKTIKTFYNII